MFSLSFDTPLDWTVLVPLLVLAGAMLFLVLQWTRGSEERALPREMLLAVAVVLFSALLAMGTVFYGANLLMEYGWGLFLTMPLWLGCIASLLYAIPRPRTMAECGTVTAWVSVISLSLLLGFGLEGAICLLMATPLMLPLGWLGAVLGYFIQRSFWSRRSAPALLVLLLLSSPVLMGAEAALDLPPPVFAVTTAVEVDAPPQVVWRHVVSFPALPPPRELLFRAGIAYPIGAEIEGRGVGAVRTCRFSTGPFVEPITVWDEPRLLRFAVTSNPPSMQELSPYPDLHPPHVEGFLVARQGQFLLTALPGGRTRLEGTTWYEHGLRPAGYWRLWSDWILHRVHRRVLEHVAALAEAEA